MKVSKQKESLEDRLQVAEKQEQLIAHKAVQAQKTITKLKMPMQARMLAEQIRGSDHQKLLLMMRENSKLKVEMAALRKHLRDSKDRQLETAVALQGKARANKKLQNLVKVVNHDRVAAERDAARKGARAREVVEQLHAERKENSRRKANAHLTAQQ